MRFICEAGETISSWAVNFLPVQQKQFLCVRLPVQPDSRSLHPDLDHEAFWYTLSINFGIPPLIRVKGCRRFQN